MDQTTEETANRDTKITGGIRKYILKPGSVSRFFLTAKHRSTFLRYLQDVLGCTSENRHVELQNTLIKKDELVVSATVETLQNWVNSFKEGQE